MPSANTNTAISILVESQLPSFVRDDNPLFASFLEAYFEYLEQKVPGQIDTGATGKGRVIERLKNLQNYRTLESTLSDFKSQLYSQFLQLFPTSSNSSFTATGNAVDFDKILPKIKDFYRARGTEKSYKFVIRALTGGDAGNDTTLYYPKDNILRASDGKWFIQKSIRVKDTKLDGVIDSTPSTFEKFTKKKIKGVSSNTTAIVERVEQFYELGTLVNEIFLSSISNTFIGGETVRTNTTNSTGHTVDLRANIFSGIITSISIGSAGQGYKVGDPVVISGGGGSGATASVSEVSTGNISRIQVLSGGSGYRSDVSASPDPGDNLLFSGGGGTGAVAEIFSVQANSYFHPNSYNIIAHSNTLAFIAGANWRAAQTIWSTVTTSNLALNSINSLATVFAYKNTGPAVTVSVTSGGQNYTALPSISVVANTSVSSLGILGSLLIKNAGSGYSVGNILRFDAPFGCWGTGANAVVASVNALGSITRVEYRSFVGGDANSVLGGTGYENGFLPTITVLGSGTGANIVVDSVLGSGATFGPDTGTIGAIRSISLLSGGQNYTSAPTIDLSKSGDGTATANAAVIQGTFTYPGYFLNQDGFPSSFNFLQDRDYYQNYSYVLRAAKTSFSSWIQSILNLVHPSGLKVFGEYLIINDSQAKSQYPNSNSITGSFGYDTIRFGSASPVSNAIYFPGNSFIWATDGFGDGAGGSANSWATLGSFWFKLDEDAPALINVGGPEMTIFEVANSHPYYNPAQRIFIGRAKDPVGVNYIPWSSNIEKQSSNTWVATNLKVDKDVLRIPLKDSEGNTYMMPMDRMKANTFAIRNQLLWSDQFQQLPWTVVNATIAADVVSNPYASLVDGDKLRETASSGQHKVVQDDLSIYKAGVPYTFSVFVNAVERNWCALYLENKTLGSSPFAVDTQYAFFDLNTLSVGAKAPASLTAQIVDIGSGWRRISITQTSSTTGLAKVSIVLANGNGADVYLGTLNSGINIWGAQFEQDGVPGHTGFLINPYSATTSVSYFGQYYLRHYFEGSSPNPSPANTLYGTGNKQVTYSFYAKAGTSSNNRIIAARVLTWPAPVSLANTTYYCNTTNGQIWQAVSSVQPGGYTFANSSNIGNGVYRYHISANPTVTTNGTAFDVFILNDSRQDNYVYPDTENPNDGIVIGGFQIEPGNTGPSLHVPTIGPNQESLPKFAYSNSSPSPLFVGFRFKNVLTGVTQAEYRTNYRVHPIVANNWYHVMISANLCSNGVYHEIPYNQGIFLNNVYSQIVVSTSGNWPSGQSSNLGGVSQASFGGNTYLNSPIDAGLLTLDTDPTRGGLKFKGYIGDLMMSRWDTIVFNPEIVSQRPQIYSHIGAFMDTRTLTSNIIGLGPLYGGSGANVINIGIDVTNGTMIQRHPRYFFRGTTGYGRAGLESGVPVPSANLANLNSGFAGFSGSYFDGGQSLFFVNGKTVTNPPQNNPNVPKGMQPGPGKEY